MSFYQKLTDLPFNHEQIRADMDKRYQGCVLLGNIQGNDMVPIYYGGHLNSTTVRFIYQGKEIDVLISDTTKDIIPFLPEVGYYNIHGNVYYLVKQPERQWKRSFCHSIYKFQAPIQGDLLTTRIDTNFYVTSVHEIYKPNDAHLDEISKAIFSNVALNRKFALCTTSSGETVLVYRKYIVGKLDFTTRTISVLQECMRQEIQDYIKHYGVSTWKLM